MNLLFVDDEPLVRRGLQSLVDWKAQGFSVQGEAGDGEEALEALLSLRPDIVLLDVRMPGMSGVEVMRRAREAGFRGKFILLTGYAEFAYARAAIRCGATDYLLKPVDEEELLRAVHRAEAELLLDNVVELYGSQSTSQLRASLLEGVLRGHAVAAREIEAAGLCRRGEPFRFLLLSCKPERAAADQAALCHELPSACAMANWERCLVVLLRGREAIAARTRAAEAVLALDPEAALFLSDTGTQPEELRERFRQARLLLDNAWFYCRASQPLCDAREFSALLGPAQPPPDRKEAGRKLRRALDALDLCAVDQDLDALLVLLRGRGLSPREARAFLLGLYREANRHLQNFFSGVTLGEEGILRIGTAANLEEAIEVLREALHSAVQCAGSSTAADVCQRVLRFIENNYSRQPLRLKDLAQELGYDSAYLGKLLKSEIGLSFNAYLEQIRLEHARAFLTQGLSVGDTAQKCGFSSIEYFSNTFRKAVGCSPSQYKSGRADSPK